MKKAATLIVVLLVVSTLSVLSAKAEGIQKLTDNAEEDFGPSICVDSLGRPHIAWVRGAPSAYDIYYGVLMGSSWSISKVTSLVASSAFHLSLCLDSNDNPHIAALTETSRWDLWYMRWSESAPNWIVEPVANGGSQSHRNVVSLAIDSNDSPHIAWAARWGNGLWGVFYATKSGVTWSIETVSHDDDSAPSIAVDLDGVPHVLWTHVGYLADLRVQYASRIGGSWAKENVPGGERGGGDNPRQIATDSYGVVHVTFIKQVSLGHFELWYGSKSAGSWSLNRIRDSAFDNYYPSIALSASNVPSVLWRSNDAGNYDVYLAEPDGSDWKIIQIASDAMDEGNNPGPSLAIDSVDDKHIAWYAPQVGSGESEVYYTRVCTVQQPAPACVEVDPNTLNLKSKGKWITCYIELPESYDVADIDVATVLLNGTVSAELYPTCVGDCDGDGVPDLMVKFSRSEVANYIVDIVGTITEPTWVTLTATGTLEDGTEFHGSDAIRVICPGHGGTGKTALLN